MRTCFFPTTSSLERECIRRVRDPVSSDDRERRQPVLRRLAFARDVAHLDAIDEKGIGDE
jgi:hypothetical protein